MPVLPLFSPLRTSPIRLWELFITHDLFLSALAAAFARAFTAMRTADAGLPALFRAVKVTNDRADHRGEEKNNDCVYHLCLTSLFLYGLAAQAAVRRGNHPRNDTDHC